MCGNDVSTIALPDQQFIDLVDPQISKGVIKIQNKQITIPKINAIKGMNFSGIIVLQLVNCRLTSDTLRALSTLGWSNLQKLNLNNNLLGPQGCKIIAEASAFGKLQVLEMNKNSIKDEGLSYLARGGYKDVLEDLSVNDNDIAGGGISRLQRAFKTLHCFSAGGNSLSDESMQQLKSNLNFQKLIYLKLSRNQITDKGLNSLLDCQNIKELQVLLIERNKIEKPREEYKSKKNISKDFFLFY